MNHIKMRPRNAMQRSATSMSMQISWTTSTEIASTIGFLQSFLLLFSDIVLCEQWLTRWPKCRAVGLNPSSLDCDHGDRLKLTLNYGKIDKQFVEDWPISKTRIHYPGPKGGEFPYGLQGARVTFVRDVIFSHSTVKCHLAKDSPSRHNTCNHTD